MENNLNIKTENFQNRHDKSYVKSVKKIATHITFLDFSVKNLKIPFFYYYYYSFVYLEIDVFNNLCWNHRYFIVSLSLLIYFCHKSYTQRRKSMEKPRKTSFRDIQVKRQKWRFYEFASNHSSFNFTSIHLVLLNNVFGTSKIS